MVRPTAKPMTNAQIADAPAGRFAVGAIPGLIIKKNQDGTGEWHLRVRVGTGAAQVEHKSVIGAYPALDVADARERARKIIQDKRAELKRAAPPPKKANGHDTSEQAPQPAPVAGHIEAAQSAEKDTIILRLMAVLAIAGSIEVTMRLGRLNTAYVRLVRDALTDALVGAGAELRR